MMVVVPYLTYGCSVWWQRGEVRLIQSKLNHLQRMACLGITGAVRTTPTAAMEVMLNLPPLHILLEKYARSTTYKLFVSKYYSHFLESESIIWKRQIQENPIFLAPSDFCTKVIDTEKPFSVLISERAEAINLVLATENSQLFSLQMDLSVMEKLALVFFAITCKLNIQCH